MFPSMGTCCVFIPQTNKHKKKVKEVRSEIRNANVTVFLVFDSIGTMQKLQNVFCLRVKKTTQSCLSVKLKNNVDTETSVTSQDI